MTTSKKTNCNAIKKILHLIDTTGPGGAETVFIQLADLLREQGYQSVVVIRGAGWVEDELKRRGLEPLVIPAKGSFAIGFLLKLRRLVRRQKIDIIQSHLLGSNVYAAMVGLLTGTPVVATYHGMVDINPSERFRGIKKTAMALGISNYVVVSQSLMESIDRQKLLDRAKTHVIYNGIDCKRYARDLPQELKAGLNLPDSAILVGSLGNIRPAKAYDVLIQAAAEVIRRHPSVHFVIAGHPKEPLITQLQELVDESGVSGHVHFIGFQQNPGHFLGQLDHFVLSSRSEGFSISTIEAMAAGLPVLATRCGGPEEIISHGENGWLVPPDEPGLLAQALCMFLDDGVLREKIALCGKDHVNNKFSVSTMIDDYKRIYQNVI